MDKQDLSLDQFQDYREAAAKLTELQTHRNEAERLIEDTNARLTARRESIDDEVNRLLQGDSGPQALNNDSLREDLGQLYHKKTVLDLAIEKQRQRIKALESEHTREICKRLRPEYQRIANRVLTAVKELCAANAEEEAFADEFRTHGLESFGSWLPCARFPFDKWNEVSGGKVYYFQKHIAENYPELRGSSK
ncbi:MAG: hypothetical protein Q8S00_01435 [Deltaproteobacteria bacterium]|nr:hypothetical protein [Deltaproteobacteria bacterium]